MALLCNYAMLVRSAYDITNDRLLSPSPGLPLLSGHELSAHLAYPYPFILIEHLFLFGSSPL
jgi:hypothetical protein